MKIEKIEINNFGASQFNKFQPMPIEQATMNGKV